MCFVMPHSVDYVYNLCLQLYFHSLHNVLMAVLCFSVVLPMLTQDCLSPACVCHSAAAWHHNSYWLLWTAGSTTTWSLQLGSVLSKIEY